MPRNKTSTKLILAKVMNAQNEHWTVQAEVVVLAMRADMTQREIASRMRISPTLVSRLAATTNLPQSIMVYALPSQNGRPDYAREIFYALLKASPEVLVRARELMARDEPLTTKDVRAMIGWKTHEPFLSGDPIEDVRRCLGIVRQHVLDLVSRAGVLPSEISKALEVESPLVVSVLQDLERLGLVRRHGERWRKAG